jgi:hypothetical protein
LLNEAIKITIVFSAVYFTKAFQLRPFYSVIPLTMSSGDTSINAFPIGKHSELLQMGWCGG